MADGDRDIDLVLVTGAGASRAFGRNEYGQPGGEPPLMSEWSQNLRKKLGTIPFAAEIVGLDDPNLSGPEFESRLGKFLRLRENFPEIERILEATAQAVAHSTTESFPQGHQLSTWHRQTNNLLRQIVEAIQESLAENFGYERLDVQKAGGAYKNLLDTLRVQPGQKLVYATTNYDRLGEAALDAAGWRPDCGERHHYIGPNAQGETLLEVAGLIDGLPRFTPVLHLHGACGWYETEGRPPFVGSEKFQRDFGTPIVQLPDPDKDYKSNFTIETLWNEFRKSLRRANRVLVLGHSLHDDTLVDALATEVPQPERVAVTLLPQPGEDSHPDRSVSDTVTTLTARLPQARQFILRFGDLEHRHLANDVAAWVGDVDRLNGKQS